MDNFSWGKHPLPMAIVMDKIIKLVTQSKDREIASLKKKIKRLEAEQ